MWEDTFRKRMFNFKSTSISQNPDDIPISIKIRVTSGCFHREHSPRAYTLVDDYFLSLKGSDNSFSFEEHESGPEVLIYLALGTAGLALAKSIIDLIVVILKARSEGIKKGDQPQAPLELIMRRIKKNGEFIDERIIRINHDDLIEKKKLNKALEKAAKKLTQTDRKGKKQNLK